MIRCVGLILLVCIADTAVAQDSWSEWIAELRDEALSKGIDAIVFDAAFEDLQPSEAASHEDAGNGHGTAELHKDADGLAAHSMIADGRAHARIHRDLLKRIAREFGVDACFVVATWGVESRFGAYTGTLPVVHSQAKLAFQSRRKTFYRGELLDALKILQDRHVGLADFIGNRVGATGQTQFMPSSWVAYAVDYDRDGRKDIWRSTPDVLASIANYQGKMGWRPSEPWAVEVSLPEGFDTRHEGHKVTKSVGAWRALGIVPVSGVDWPEPGLEGSIVRLRHGPVYLALHNFRVIMRYNDSVHYAASVGQLASGICASGQAAN